MKKIKVLRIIARLNIGGPAIHAVLLTAGLDKERFSSLLVSGQIASDEGDMLYYARKKHVEPYFIPHLKRKINFINDIIALIKIYRLIKKEKPDIVHTHTAKAGALGRLAAVLAGNLKLVHTFHGHIFDGYFNKIEAGIFLLIERVLAKFSSKIITVSESVKGELIQLGVCRPDKIEVIPLGFELDEFLSISPGRNNEVFNVGIIGRLVPIKNHRLFLDAAAKVTRDNPQMVFKFKIIGDGELRKGLEEYARRLNIAAYVDFLGWQRDLCRVYSGLDAVVLASINEGTPVSLIEAMASGKPVVATDVGGIRDLLGRQKTEDKIAKADFNILERGLICSSGDSESLASAIRFLARNPDLGLKLSLEAREFVRHKFSKNRLIKDIEGLYERIVK